MVDEAVEALATARPDGHLEGVERQVGAERARGLPADHVAREDVGAATSVGSRGDSYDNALAESFHGLYKAELIHKQGPWRGLDDVEYKTLGYVDWFNRRRLHGEIGMVPPAEFEAAYYAQRTSVAVDAAADTHTSAQTVTDVEVAG
jgi:hypothetical protein